MVTSYNVSRSLVGCCSPSKGSQQRLAYGRVQMDMTLPQVEAMLGKGEDVFAKGYSVINQGYDLYVCFAAVPYSSLVSGVETSEGQP